MLFIFFGFNAWSQCGTGVANVGVYGTNSWIGYYYDNVDDFTNASYLGSKTETDIFDESWCGDNCLIALDNFCFTTTETFTVRFRNRKNFACGYYNFTIGSDDGSRLFIDGVSVLDTYSLHAYATVTTATPVFLTGGNHDLVLEYYENSGQNRISYSFTMASTGANGGTVAASQSSCAASFDPVAFTSTTAATFCAGGTITYQWENSPDGSTGWTGIGGTNSTTYDATALTSTTYYRRAATVGATTVYSNTLTVIVDPAGSQTTAGANTWIGHIYDGANNFVSASYQGEMNEAQQFDESFCGDNCTQVITGCDFNTETFSVRYLMTYTIPTGGRANYTFTAGGDDGYRFSINGGSTWIIDNYGDHSYTTSSSAVTTLNAGTYNFVLEFYENGGGNRVSFAFSTIPLPVTWSYWDGYYENGQNVVTWRTATERNNSGFLIERSVDGTKFDSLGFIVGHGNATTQNEYKFYDTAPALGWNYYRIKQIDYDGKFEYSRLIPVFVDNLGSLSVYPNPASSEIFISHVGANKTIRVVLKGVMTNRSYTLAGDPKQPARFSLSSVAPGMYLITITIDDVVQSEKLLVMQ